jgi:hypothetical protein
VKAPIRSLLKRLIVGALSVRDWPDITIAEFNSNQEHLQHIGMIFD